MLFTGLSVKPHDDSELHFECNWLHLCPIHHPKGPDMETKWTLQKQISIDYNCHSQSEKTFTYWNIMNTIYGHLSYSVLLCLTSCHNVISVVLRALPEQKRDAFFSLHTCISVASVFITFLNWCSTSIVWVISIPSILEHSISTVDFVFMHWLFS